jgi:hypothetical protein
VAPCPAALLPGLSAAIPTMTPKIIPCIFRAILAQDEADGPSGRPLFQAWQIQRKRLFGGSSFPGFVLGAARRSCRILLLRKVKCSNSGLGAYAESTSGRRSS